MRLLNLSVVVSLLAVVAPTLTLAAPVDIIDTNPSTHGTDSDSTHSDTYSHALNYAFAVSGRSEHSDRSDPADASDPSSFDTSSLSTRGISLTGPFAGKKPQPTDVRQYDDENCSFLATLIAMSMTDTSYLMSVFTQDRSTGRWVVVFPNSQCHPVTVSKMGRTADINAQVDTWWPTALLSATETKEGKAITEATYPDQTFIYLYSAQPAMYPPTPGMWLDARTSYVAGAVKLLRSANKYPTVISFSLRNNDDVVLDVLGNGKLTAPHSYAVKRFDGKHLILLDPYEPWNEVVFKWTELVQHVSMVVQANPSHGQTAGKSSIEACSLSNTATAMATATGTSATGRRRVATRTSARTTARTRTRTTRRRTSTTTTTRQRVATAAPAATKTRKVVPTTLPTADEADAADEQDMAIEYA